MRDFAQDMCTYLHMASFHLKRKPLTFMFFPLIVPFMCAVEKKKKEKRRTPAWCDRVLWLSRRKRLHQLAYNRAEITASDHRPVAAAFLLQVCVSV